MIFGIGTNLAKFFFWFGQEIKDNQKVKRFCLEMEVWPRKYIGFVER